MTAPATALPAAGGSIAAADLVLVRRALAGEGAAVDGVLDRLACVARFVFRLNRSLGYGLGASQLEDVVQQVYLAVWPRLVDYTGDAALDSWVYGFCRNCLRAEARRRAQSLRLVQPGLDESDTAELAASGRDPELTLLEVERLDLLHDELARLPEPEAEAVRLRHLEDWSFEQIARHKAVPASTIKDRCYRALQKLKARLERRHGNPR